MMENAIVLVPGSGGREHALAWKLAQSLHVGEVVCAPGNGGTATEEKCRNVDIPAGDIASLVRLAEEERFDLTVVGPEDPLCRGIVDQWPKGMRIWGPNAQMARLEGSKIYAKELMVRLGIPTASFRSFDRAQDAADFLNEQPADHPWVVKADGLAAGKGVMVCRDRAESIAAVHLTMAERAFGAAGDRIVIEERLHGAEVSLIALCHSGKVIPLVTAKDYKPVGEDDIGPNTGGMGCFSPAQFPIEEVVRGYCNQFIQPIVDEIGYEGTLYAGLMLTDNGPMLLEYNVRFGDPETQVILPRMAGDLFTTLCHGDRFEMLLPELAWARQTAAVTVVMASEGYPGQYRKGEVITGLDAVREQTRAIVFHAGTKLEEGKIITAGGRVLNVTCTATWMPEARNEVYKAVELINWPGAFYRRDIAMNV